MRESVAHLQAVFAMSERRACRIVRADRKTVRYRSRRAPDTALRGRYPAWPRRDVASAIGGCSCCYAGRVSALARTGFIGCIVKKG